MNLKCVVIDDEQHAIEVITDHITEMPGLTIFKTFTSPIQALTELSLNDDIDLLFMDIDMPGINGLELAKNIREKAKYLIFTTAHPDYALQAFDVQSDQYLLKPISFAKFALGIDRILKKESNNARAAKETDQAAAALYIKGDHKYAFSNIAIDEILYIKSLQNYIQIITKAESHTTYLTLKEIDKALERHPFIRVNKSNIVAKAAIKKVDGNIIRLVNNEVIQIGEGYKEAFFTYVQNSLLKSNRNQ
ncbi:LytTR family two component transcriptional regulator [Pedobacter psychrotolerans]|uniref:DNA-binding response regulator n=1 Tax=Pedobacter psychrotolerans TaxID=1843235 RepID=A0A4R2HDB4_9SPHI|nr:LytTR family DNA-binding domain-containing protein [Pedobacter psychrotolerans]TCO23691.1 LytTR family two component transcriptional regulator [Pedobacter psychrotolerans]GGE61870.1 DNA-binding response regulator [Pedobacter psychrotolerans]